MRMTSPTWPCFEIDCTFNTSGRTWDATRVALPGGQSGNPLSPHYDDLLAVWRRGEGVPLP